MIKGEENTALYTVAEFVYQVVKNGDHVKALENMDLSDDGFFEDLSQAGFFWLIPELSSELAKDGEVSV